MRFAEITPPIVRRAIELYLSEAYPNGVPDRIKLSPVIASANTTKDLLGAFTDESKRDGDAHSQRWILRLGNERYPFMKFVLQESVLEGEFVFAVDTHDAMEIRPHFPDYEAWQKLKSFNLDLRLRIEDRWQAADLDTCAHLAEKATSYLPTCAGRGRGRRVLVVDDERDLAEAFASVLRSEGYEVEIANNGREAIERVGASRPDLILLDYELPELDGVQVIEQLRADPATRDLPVLLASASNVSLSELCRASGYLRKPFSAEMLLTLAEHQLRGLGESGTRAAKDA
jgi:CheY-like chemotaxis protein